MTNKADPFSVKKAFKKVTKSVTKMALNPFKSIAQVMQGDFKGAGKTVIDTTLTMGGEGVLWKTGENPYRKDKAIAKKKMNERLAQDSMMRKAAGINTGQGGLVDQLREGKGSGGGSYTDTAKNSLGGKAGKTGTFTGRTG